MMSVPMIFFTFFQYDVRPQGVTALGVEKSAMLNFQHSAIFVNRGAFLDTRNKMTRKQAGPRFSESKVERRRPERRALFLAEISRTLAESLDDEQTVSSVARLAMPELGAWCIVDLFDDSGEVRRLSIMHPDPMMQSIAREL